MNAYLITKRVRALERLAAALLAENAMLRAKLEVSERGANRRAETIAPQAMPSLHLKVSPPALPRPLVDLSKAPSAMETRFARRGDAG